MQIEALSNQTWNLTHPGGNVTTASGAFPARVPTTTPPYLVSGGYLTSPGDGVIAFGGDIGQPTGAGGEMSPLNLLLIPISTTTVGVVNVNIIGWRATRLGVGLPLWIPVLLATYQATMGAVANTPGIAGSDLGATTVFATTITASVGPSFSTVVTAGQAIAAPDWYFVSPTSNAIGLIVQRSLGFRFLEVTFSGQASTPTANALYCKM